jgi:hypothetical protein
MPNETQVTKDFLRQIFGNEKKLLKKNEIRYISVPCWDELAVKKLWPDLK